MMEVTLADELVEIIRERHESVEQFVHEAIVIGLYRLGKVPGDRAAELLRMSQPEFIEFLDRKGVSPRTLRTESSQSTQTSTDAPPHE